MKFRKKAVVIDAIQWTGDNLEEVYNWRKGFPDNEKWTVWTPSPESKSSLIIPTLEDVRGTAGHEASPGDWIIRGVKGEFYPCKPDIFDLTYDRAEH
jgi:hypothetical protein